MTEHSICALGEHCEQYVRNTLFKYGFHLYPKSVIARQKVNLESASFENSPGRYNF